MRHQGLFILFLATLIAACSEPGKDPTQSVDARIQQARMAHPSDPVAAANAGNAEARELFSELAATTPSKHEGAAIAFLGYYTKYTESLPRHCSGSGAPIVKLATKFAEMHQRSYEVAMRFPGAVDTLERGRSGIDHAAQDELSRMAAHWQVDAKGACEHLEENFEMFAADADFATVNPEAQQLLDQLKR